MISKLKRFFAVTFMLLLLSISAFACTCVRDKIKARGFSGQVFAVLESKPNYKEPLPRATIRLLKRTDDGDKVIAEVVADDAGRFSLEHVKAGKYILAATAQHFQSVWTEIEIVHNSGGKKDEIIIGLAPTIGCCEGYAKVQNSA